MENINSSRIDSIVMSIIVNGELDVSLYTQEEIDLALDIYYSFLSTGICTTGLSSYRYCIFDISPDI